jgi:thioredoxin
MKTNISNIDSKNFDQEVIQSKAPVIVKFWASWCVPCKAFASTFEDTAEEYHDVKFAKVQVDSASNMTLAQDLNVKAVPRILGYKNGVQYLLDDLSSRQALKEFIDNIRNS